ncbi:hypothetical protein [Kitasatospora brasiliensis]|uniref:hypothetical protein n=1 Tax=Kitasatospora brasiliensis TaxID=3058040 RepID=UPI00292D7DA4|nr:hypothetical protein [Kitasatospora sp. K002]
MHESSTTGGGDETPREDGATKDSAANAAAPGGAPTDRTGPGGAPTDRTGPGGAPTDRTGPGGAATPPPVQDAAGEPAADAAAPEAPAERRARRAPERSQAEQDEIFAALVAQFDDPVDLNNPNWPEVENLRAQNELKGGPKDDPAGGRADLDDLSGLAPQPRPRSGRPVMPAGGAGPRDFELAEETDEGHFVPPEPPPLPAADVTAKFAWLAVLGGPALLLIDAVVWREISGWPAWVGITAFLGGFVTLVARMKDRDEDEPEDPDHGAVV